MALQGRLESAGPTVRGWAIDEDNKDKLLLIEIRINNKNIFVVSGNYRDDLLAVFGSANHGFEIEISAFLRSGQNRVECLFAETGELLNYGTQEYEHNVPFSKVYQGLDGWLFLHNDSNKLIEQLFGYHDFSPRDEIILRTELYLRRLVADDVGAKNLTVVAPEKHIIYSDMFSHARFISEKRYLRLFEKIYNEETGRDLLYPSQILKNARTSMSVYHKTDTHMNSYGMLVVVEAMLENAGVNATRLRELLRENRRTIIGDLGGKLVPPAEENVASLQSNGCINILSGDINDRFEFNISRTGAHLMYENSDPIINEKAILFGTSSLFFHAEIFASIFSKSMFIWSNKWDMSLIRSLKPNYIVNVLAERFIPYQLRDLDSNLPPSVGHAAAYW